MKICRRRRKNTRVNVTAHRRAVADPDIAAAINELRVSWKRLNRVDRGDRLRELARLGCSTRGLAAALRISATTVRRHIEIAALPENKRIEVTKGASAKKALATTAKKRRLRRVRERLQHERQTGQLSGELADVIIGFCRADVGSQVALSRDELPLFLTGVAQRLQRLETSAPRLRVARRLSLAEKFRATKPNRPESDFWIEQHAEWLADFIRAAAPEREIWENALVKAHNRDRELDRHASPGIGDFSVGKIRTVEVPTRRVTRPAREALKRQGRQHAKD